MKNVAPHAVYNRPANSRKTLGYALLMAITLLGSFTVIAGVDGTPQFCRLVSVFWSLLAGFGFVTALGHAFRMIDTE
ncbi:hypothetical protein VARIO8X_90044 [Burkholderiales bacterium 8X]|nr:hypothetical protein VARIO8X_90044 [Burkholderiales bacterium 8X]